jgi:hypothetical protein
LYGIKESPLL